MIMIERGRETDRERRGEKMVLIEKKMDIKQIKTRWTTSEETITFS